MLLNDLQCMLRGIIIKPNAKKLSKSLQNILINSRPMHLIISECLLTFNLFVPGFVLSQSH